jgi:hypothetical protein
VVDRGFDPPKEKKQTRSGACRASRAHSREPEARRASGALLDDDEDGMRPWDIEMTVEEPLSNNEDWVPHGVSDSESESEKDSD